MRRSSIVLAVIGVLLIAAAFVVYFAVVPAAKKLPSDLDVTLQYTGKASGLDVKKLTSGDLSGALVREVDATLDRHVYVTDSTSTVAVVHDDSKLTAGTIVVEDNHVYGVDRESRGVGPAPEGTAVEAQTGLTIALPPDPEPGDTYKIYDSATQTGVTMKFVGTEERAGRSTHHYTAEASGPAKNPVLVASLPAGLPKSLASTLIPFLPTDVQQAVAPLADKLPDPIPLTYTVTSTYGVWADTELGAPVDSTLSRTIMASASLGLVAVPLLPVLDVKVSQTDQSVRERADYVATKDTQLALLSIWLPAGLAVLGIALLGIAIIRRHPPARPAVATRAPGRAAPTPAAPAPPPPPPPATPPTPPEPPSTGAHAAEPPEDAAPPPDAPPPESEPPESVSPPESEPPDAGPPEDRPPA